MVQGLGLENLHSHLSWILRMGMQSESEIRLWSLEIGSPTRMGLDLLQLQIQRLFRVQKSE